MLSPSESPSSRSRSSPQAFPKRPRRIGRFASAADSAGGSSGAPFAEAFVQEGLDDGWRRYLLCFEEPNTSIFILTDSSNREDMNSGL